MIWPLDTLGSRLSAFMGLPREPEPAPDPHVIWVLNNGRWESLGPFPDRKAADLHKAAHIGTRPTIIASLIDPSRWRA